MKKILYVLSASAALVFSSCNPEILDTSPTDSVSGETMLNDT